MSLFTAALELLFWFILFYYLIFYISSTIQLFTSFCSADSPFYSFQNALRYYLLTHPSIVFHESAYLEHMLCTFCTNPLIINLILEFNDNVYSSSSPRRQISLCRDLLHSSSSEYDLLSCPASLSFSSLIADEMYYSYWVVRIILASRLLSSCFLSLCISTSSASLLGMLFLKKAGVSGRFFCVALYYYLIQCLLTATTPFLKTIIQYSSPIQSLFSNNNRPMNIESPSMMLGVGAPFTKQSLSAWIAPVRISCPFYADAISTYYSFYYMEQDIIIKVCIVGEPGVGKTSMLYQYIFKKFDPNSRPTIGCDFSTKLKSTSDGKPIRLQLWDIAGQQRFNSVSKMYIRGALGCVIVCSSQDESSLNETLKWKKIIDDNCDQMEGDSQVIPTLLVQNKSDLVKPQSAQEFQKKEYLEQFAKTNGFCGVSVTSAKQNTGIDECFQQLLDEIIKRKLIKDTSASTSGTAPQKRQENQPHRLVLNPPKTEQKKKCC